MSDRKPTPRPTPTHVRPNGEVIIDGAKWAAMMRDLAFWASYKPKGERK